MTRVHVRLLGPCFKTGPKSTQSSSVADRYIVCRPVEGVPYDQQRARTGDGARSVTSEYRGARLRRSRRTREKSAA